MIASDNPDPSGELAGGGHRGPPHDSGAIIQLRRGQCIAVESLAPDTVIGLLGGCLVCDRDRGNGTREALLLLYPGDIVSRGTLPALPALGLTAAAQSRISRARLASDATTGLPSTSMQRELAASSALLLGRAFCRATSLARLPAQERLLALLTELALNLGSATGRGATFELPLSRRELADYLALNPDTVSRLMSRLRASGLVVVPTRRRAIARDLGALVAASRLGPMIEALQRPDAPARAAKPAR